MEFVEPGVEFDNLLDRPGGGLLELAPVQDVDEAPGDDGLGGQLQLEIILLITRSSADFIMFIASSVPLVENLLNSVYAQNVITFSTFYCDPKRLHSMHHLW